MWVVLIFIGILAYCLYYYFSYWEVKTDQTIKVKVLDGEQWSRQQRRRRHQTQGQAQGQRQRQAQGQAQVQGQAQAQAQAHRQGQLHLHQLPEALQLLADHIMIPAGLQAFLAAGDPNVFVEIIQEHGPGGFQGGDGGGDDPGAIQTDVHDHAIHASIIKSYHGLVKWVDENPELQIPVEDALKDIKLEICRFAVNGASETNSLQTMERAYSTVKAMFKHNSRLHDIDRGELDILGHVWSRIKAPVNAAVSSELIARLIEQLADASKGSGDLDENTCCLTGRISRVIQTLESLDAESIVNVTSTSVIRLELSDKVPHLIGLYQRSWTTDQIDKYNNGDESLAQELRKHIDEALRRDYVDSGLLTEHTYHEITRDYLEAI